MPWPAPSGEGKAIARAFLSAKAGECDLVAKSRTDDDEAGFLYVGSGLFATDRRHQPPITDAALRSLAAEGHPVTCTCVPPGSGERIGVDRDGDGVWDGDERRAHSDPADPRSRRSVRTESLLSSGPRHKEAL